ncbi:MAG: class I adenylate-forming enzyme family protein [Verrucomicrobiota bacterium]
MLYERWRRVAQERGGAIALRDGPTGRAWTFAQLADEAERATCPDSRMAYACGAGGEFVFSVLSAWRHGRVVCPLEPGQAPPELPRLPRECAHVKLTSGTTGAARAILFTAEQLAADADNIVATMGLRAEWPNVGAISLAHSYGFSNLVTPLLLHGIPLSVTGTPLPEAVQRACAREKAVTLAGVPALWRAWHEAGAITPTVRLAISAGAPLPLALEQTVFNERGVKIHNFYGSSECGGIAYDDSDAPRADAACTGAPLRNVHLSQTDDGCLVVRSRAVAMTYWPEAQANLGNGCFRASDLVELKDGLVYLRGRAGDLINVAGRKVSPEQIERALQTHPEVRDCLVFSVPEADAQRGELIVACVAGMAGLEGERLRQYLLEKLPAWQVPREWVVVDALPVNQRGKLSRAEWRAKYLRERA